MGCTHPKAYRDYLPGVDPVPASFRRRYRIGQMLGEGAFGVVYECVDKLTQRRAAVKVMDRGVMTESEERSLHNEVEILQMLHHPNIVKCYGCYVETGLYYIVMEVCDGGELLKRIIRKAKHPHWYTEERARVVMRALLSALKHCHKRGVIHRDVKPENLLLADRSNDSEVKLADFGLSARVRTRSSSRHYRPLRLPEGDVEGRERYLLSMAGTAVYMAPEMVSREPYGMAVDVWSAGVVMYVLLGGYHPFYSSNLAWSFNLIKKGEYDLEGRVWNSVSDEAKDLISRLLTVDPLKRLTAKEALMHPWIQTPRRILRTRSLSDTVAFLREYYQHHQLKKLHKRYKKHHRHLHQKLERERSTATLHPHTQSSTPHTPPHTPKRSQSVCLPEVYTTGGDRPKERGSKSVGGTPVHTQSASDDGIYRAYSSDWVLSVVDVSRASSGAIPPPPSSSSSSSSSSASLSPSPFLPSLEDTQSVPGTHGGSVRSSVSEHDTVEDGNRHHKRVVVGKGGGKYNGAEADDNGSMCRPQLKRRSSWSSWLLPRRAAKRGGPHDDATARTAAKGLGSLGRLGVASTLAVDSGLTEDNGHGSGGGGGGGGRVGALNTHTSCHSPPALRSQSSSGWIF